MGTDFIWTPMVPNGWHSLSKQKLDGRSRRSVWYWVPAFDCLRSLNRLPIIQFWETTLIDKLREGQWRLFRWFSFRKRRRGDEQFANISKRQRVTVRKYQLLFCCIDQQPSVIWRPNRSAVKGRQGLRRNRLFGIQHIRV